MMELSDNGVPAHLENKDKRTILLYPTHSYRRASGQFSSYRRPDGMLAPGAEPELRCVSKRFLDRERGTEFQGEWG
jgi:hypothetical protein